MSSERAGHIILIVEDHPANLLLAQIVLTRAGFQVMEAGSADEAKRQLQQVIPHLILMDVGLLGQDGISLTREFKADANTAAIPIVALTAGALDTDRERALAAGCDAFISKPFNKQYLVDVITALVNDATGPASSI